MPKQVQVNKVYPVLISVLVTLLVAALLLFLFSLHLRATQEDLDNRMFAILDEAASDVFATLTPLNDHGYTECSEANLRVMEAALFNASFAKQIMFYQDNAGLCSTGSGILAEPVKRPAPDFRSAVNGAEVWVNRRFVLDLTGEQISAIIIKLGNYSALTDPGVFELGNDLPFQWQFLFRSVDNPADFAHISGTENLYRPAENLHEMSRNTVFYHEACDAMRPYLCLVLTTNTANLVSHYPETVALVILLSLALGNISGYRYNNFLQSRREMTARVSNGFSHGAYYWQYQPIVDMETNTVIGCEVLSRFRDHFGPAMPDAYLPILREAGLTAAFTRLMVKTALTELDTTKSIPDGFKVSLNIFPADVISGDIEEILKLPEIRSSRFAITLEITEEEYLDEISSQNYLEKIHRSGLAISIDDFGTGYSNLKQLKKLNCTYLKVDRTYIADLEDEPIRSSLIPHIINMAEQLGLTVIAEGIETFDQQVILVGLGIRYGQGAFFGAPMPLEDLVSQLERRGKAGVFESVILET